MIRFDITLEDTRVIGEYRDAMQPDGTRNPEIKSGWLVSLHDGHTGKSFNMELTCDEQQALSLLLFTMDEPNAAFAVEEQKARALLVNVLKDCPQECYPFP